MKRLFAIALSLASLPAEALACPASYYINFDGNCVQRPGYLAPPSYYAPPAHVPPPTYVPQTKEQGARLWELRTATSLAELWHEHGNPSAARELLTPIYESFPEKGSAADVVAARDFLDAL